MRKRENLMQQYKKERLRNVIITYPEPLLFEDSAVRSIQVSSSEGRRTYRILDLPFS